MLGMVLLGSGTALAARYPEAVYQERTEVVSIDNTYLVAKDLDAYSPTVRITAVGEDDVSYRVSYELSTIALLNHAWRDVTEVRALKVYKADLRGYRDLGGYVTEELEQIIDHELAVLKKTQEFERRQMSEAVVTTEHAGLVGMLMDDSTETLPRYTPPEVEEDATAAERSPENGDEAAAVVAADVRGRIPVIEVLGETPYRVAIGETYRDLGARATDPEDGALAVDVWLDGALADRIAIGTALSGEYQVLYRAVDSDGNHAEAVRQVVVYDPKTMHQETGREGNAPTGDEGDDDESEEEEEENETDQSGYDEQDGQTQDEQEQDEQNEQAEVNDSEDGSNDEETIEEENKDEVISSDEEEGVDDGEEGTEEDVVEGEVPAEDTAGEEDAEIADDETAEEEEEEATPESEVEADTDADTETTTPEDTDADADTETTEEVETEAVE